MLAEKALPQITDEDRPQITRTPWLTHRHLVVFVTGWLVLFAFLSIFLANPFASEASASSTPDYARVMFLHGLLIGMVGLGALLTCNILCLRSTHVRVWIAGGVVFATMLAAIGGIWDRSIPGSEVAMWTQIFGFFALDEILIMLVAGMIGEWLRHGTLSRTLPFLAAFTSAVAMFIAAVMGHLAGWIMEFGNFPTILGSYAHAVGFASIDDFAGALVGAHSHEMAVGSMALIASILAVQFGYTRRQGIARTIARIGIAMIAVGTAAMTVIYVAAGWTTWSPPPMFVNGANGIASDDIVTGILVMGGGVIVAAALVLTRTLLRRPVRLAAAWAWVLSFATVVVAGFAIEMNTAYFGAGDPKAAGAASDAIFTWLHQDIGLFLMPTMVLVMLAVERLVAGRSHPAWIGWTAIVGTTITFVGGLVYVFITPTMYGAGYVISTIGLLITGVSLLTAIWWSVAGHIPETNPAREPALPGGTA